MPIHKPTVVLKCFYGNSLSELCLRHLKSFLVAVNQQVQILRSPKHHLLRTENRRTCCDTRDLRNDENRSSHQQCSSRRTSRCIIEKHDRWDGWRYHWRQRYRSLSPLASQCTGKIAGIFVEIWNRFFLTLWCKDFVKTWCSITQKRQKLVTEVYHKSYSSPDPR